MHFVGDFGDASVHAHFQLVVGQHVLPHDDRQPGARLQVVVRNGARLQDGRPADLLHFPHARQHEQAEVLRPRQVNTFHSF